MNIVLGLVLVSLAVALGFLAAFGWAIRSGQFDDTTTPPLRLLADDADETPTMNPLSKRKSTP